jgi:hypothetical protein
MLMFISDSLPTCIYTHARTQAHTHTRTFWEELNTWFPLILDVPHKKRRVQEFLYYCLYIRFIDNVYT